MEWIDGLRGTVVGVDTAPLIYLIEENSIYLPFVRRFFEAVDRGDFRVVTSIRTLTESAGTPVRHGDDELADQYRRILLQANQLATVPVSAAKKQRDCGPDTPCERRMPFSWRRLSVPARLHF